MNFCQYGMVTCWTWSTLTQHGICRPAALPTSPAPSQKPSNILDPSQRTLGEIPGTPEFHAQNLAAAGMGEFAHGKSLKRSMSRGQEGEEDGVDAEELEMQPLWQHNGHSDSSGTASYTRFMNAIVSRQVATPLLHVTYQV